MNTNIRLKFAQEHECLRTIPKLFSCLQATTFDEALRPAGFVLEKDSTAKISRAYEYNKDGSLNYVEDLLNPVFDRLQRYDHQGRLAVAGKPVSGLML